VVSVAERALLLGEDALAALPAFAHDSALAPRLAALLVPALHLRALALLTAVVRRARRHGLNFVSVIASLLLGSFPPPGAALPAPRRAARAAAAFAAASECVAQWGPAAEAALARPALAACVPLLHAMAASAGGARLSAAAGVGRANKRRRTAARGPGCEPGADGGADGDAPPPPALCAPRPSRPPGG
jgi:hypothetical protein